MFSKKLFILIFCMVILAAAFRDPAKPTGGQPYYSYSILGLRHTRQASRVTRESSKSSYDMSNLVVMDNHKPVFTECSNYRPVMVEELPVGTYVFTVHATDRDPEKAGGTVTYKFVTAVGEKERFHVDPQSGIITTADVFDHDEPAREKEVFLIVRASDNGVPQLDDACTIKIKIEDINDNHPIFDKVDYTESVPQDLPIGGQVMRISATDIDDGVNSKVKYRLDNLSDQGYFYVDADNGVICLNKTIDKPPGYRFSLSAVVQDMGKVPLTTVIDVFIKVVESNKKGPEFTDVPKMPIKLKENFANYSKTITTIAATSNIPGKEKIRFEIVKGHTEQTNKRNTFVLYSEENVAYIKLGGLMDYERITEYTLTIRIQNDYKLAAETLVQILVQDVNDNMPVFNEVYSGVVSENEDVGTHVMQVQAFDADGTSANNQITYSFVNPDELFDIDMYSGNITTNTVLDREGQSQYNLRVIATDNSESALIPGQHNIAQKVILIDIADKNDNPPHFTNLTYTAESVGENTNLNRVVIQVTAIDPDAAADVTYSIVEGNVDNAFSINNLGEIRVNNTLDYEQITEYSLDVRASDGVFEDYTKVLIKIENFNDNPPVFLANYTKTIQEEMMYDGCIVSVEAYDPDVKDRSAPQNIAFSLMKEEDTKYMSISENGCMRLRLPLDRDPPTGRNQWPVIVTAADNGGILGSASIRKSTEVLITLTDINDNAPFLTNSQPVIWDENQSKGVIVNLTASDNDSLENGPPFTYHINGTLDTNMSALFNIIDNQLIAVNSFDRETQKDYYVPVTITDAGYPPMSGVSMLHVVIGDVNDNAMRPGSSEILVYSYEGNMTDTEVGRAYVEDLDDWDSTNKTWMWVPSYEDNNPYFDIQTNTGIIVLRAGTPKGVYHLKFNVSEENRPYVYQHNVEANVVVTVKYITEEAVNKSGSVRFVNVTAEEFILPESDGTSKTYKLHKRLAQVHNVSMDNVDIFTIMNKKTTNNQFLDVRYAIHGSPYYSAERLNTVLANIYLELETELSTKIYMTPIDECLIEKVQCENSCRNVLVRSNVSETIYTNRTSFVGVSVRVAPECSCDINEQRTCLNGGTPVGDKCECPPGHPGPHCELPAVGFTNPGWAMYPTPNSCDETTISFSVTAYKPNCLILYMGPVYYNRLLPIRDFLSVELMDGFAVVKADYGSGTFSLNNSVIHVADGKPHTVDISVTKTSVELIVDKCTLSACMSVATPVGQNEILNINGPLQIGGSYADIRLLGAQYDWKYVPETINLEGCVSNLTYGEQMYNLGSPSWSTNAEYTCERSTFTAVTIGVDSNFLIALLACIIILVVLLAVFVLRRRRRENWTDKELDDIRENIIAYADEGGGEGDAAYDLHVLRHLSEKNKGADDSERYLPAPEPLPGPSGINHQSAIRDVPRLPDALSDEILVLPSPPEAEPQRGISIVSRLPDDLSDEILVLPSPPEAEPRRGISIVSRLPDDLSDEILVLPSPPEAEPRRGISIVSRLPEALSDGIDVLPSIPDPVSMRGTRPISNPQELPHSSGVHLIPLCLPPNGAPNIGRFLEEKKGVVDGDPEGVPKEDVRFYAYEGDGNTTGSLSSLASCTDEDDLKFDYLTSFGPRFRKLADLYGNNQKEGPSKHEESWC